MKIKGLLIVLCLLVALVIGLVLFKINFKTNHNIEKKSNIISINEAESGTYYKDLTINNISLEEKENETIFSLDVINEKTKDINLTSFDVELLNKDKELIGKFSCYLGKGVKSNEKINCNTKVDTKFDNVYYYRFVSHAGSDDFEINTDTPENVINSDGNMSDTEVAASEGNKNNSNVVEEESN